MTDKQISDMLSICRSVNPEFFADAMNGTSEYQFKNALLANPALRNRVIEMLNSRITTRQSDIAFVSGSEPTDFNDPFMREVIYGTETWQEYQAVELPQLEAQITQAKELLEVLA